MLVCPLGIQKNKHDPITCKQDGGLCGHVFYCQLSMKWKQTDKAKNCTRRNTDESGNDEDKKHSG